MAQETDIKKLPIGKQITPSEEFVRYCEIEFERRLNTGEDFEVAAYREVMEVVAAKLTLLETESVA